MGLRNCVRIGKRSLVVVMIVDANRAHSDGACTFDIGVPQVAYVHRVLGLDPELLEGRMEDICMGFGNARFVGEDLHL